MDAHYLTHVWLSVTVTVGMLCRMSTQDTFLFITSAGDRDNPAGLYGAKVSDNQGVTSLEPWYDFHVGYHCTHFNGFTRDGLDLKSVAYDQISGQVLMQRQEDQDRTVTLYQGHVCHNGGCKNKKVPRVLFESFRFRYLTPKTFAYQNEDIYFLSQEKRDVSQGETRNVIQLRKLNRCHDKFPVNSYARYELGHCSEVLSPIVEEKSKFPAFETMSGLHVVEIGDLKYAFLTLQEIMFTDTITGEYDDIAINLYVVILEENGVIGFPYRLHRELIGPNYHRFIMKQIGNVDYRQGKLCWSAIDRILCADFTPDRLEIRKVRYAVAPGAANDVVCRGGDLYGNVVTGVAVASVVRDEIELFFGCLAGVSGTGGTGYLRMRHYNRDGAPRLMSFRNTTSELFSGQMFLSHKCRLSQGSLPPQDYDSQLDEGPRFGASSQGVASIRNSCWIIVVIFSILSTFPYC